MQREVAKTIETQRIQEGWKGPRLLRVWLHPIGAPLDSYLTFKYILCPLHFNTSMDSLFLHPSLGSPNAHAFSFQRNVRDLVSQTTPLRTDTVKHVYPIPFYASLILRLSTSRRRVSFDISTILPATSITPFQTFRVYFFKLESPQFSSFSFLVKDIRNQKFFPFALTPLSFFLSFCASLENSERSVDALHQSSVSSLGSW